MNHPIFTIINRICIAGVLTRPYAAAMTVSGRLPTFFIAHGGGPMPLMNDPSHAPLIKHWQQLRTGEPRDAMQYECTSAENHIGGAIDGISSPDVCRLCRDCQGAEAPHQSRCGGVSPLGERE